MKYDKVLIVVKKKQKLQGIIKEVKHYLVFFVIKKIFFFTV